MNVHRWRHPGHGAENHQARFSPEERADIRERLKREGVRQIARERQCAPSTISRIGKSQD